VRPADGARRPHPGCPAHRPRLNSGVQSKYREDDAGALSASFACSAAVSALPVRGSRPCLPRDYLQPAAPAGAV